ncbi:histone-lysine N-methyltransferase EZA1, partial [Medicago truncatula]|uniref:histone-lysine N-methyltransferase EZA1 n=1 Tax=Medicago truncatula TaxID=3880 RepID=UPI001967483A
MASNIATSASRPRGQEQQGEATIEDPQILMNKIKKLKEKIQKERMETVQKKLQINEKNLQCELSKVMTTVSRYDSSIIGKDNVQTHSLKIEHPLEMYDRFPRGLGNKYLHVVHDVSFKKTFRLQRVEKIPHYTTWLHLIRNERMTKADAFSARRNIYYDQHAGETMICSDTDEEVQENKEVKRDFSYGEDKLLWMAIEEYCLTDEVLSIVQSYIGGTTAEIEERYKYLKEKSMLSKDSRENASNSGLCLDKSLSEALSTFDHFFCRRCLIFDCPLHGCSQPLIYSREKQPIWQPKGEREVCGDHCYLKIKDVNISSEGSTSGSFSDNEIQTMENVDEILAPSNSKEITYKIELMRLSNSMEGQDDKMHNIIEWKPLEKDICLKGIEMFGKNSCLIYRNLLAGFKTCMEIDRYMREEMPNGSTDENGTFVAQYNDHEGPSSSKRGRRKGKNKKSGYLSKSRGIRSSGKRMIAGDTEPYKPHYTPCECQGMCTKKECPCLLQGSCCEKYCGCDKQCRYRFRGCLCVKSQCRTRQCPCFAAKRECDPDVCKDCWASCGDDTFKGPIPRGDGQCENMNLLLGKNKQKILLARSDVAGWGAFLKNSVNKNEYLGEYTGELISHKEAEKRGKLYERENFSFLFDVDDKA